jgi:anti-anti-sigma factor
MLTARMAEGSGFQARCEPRNGAVVVVVRGELDLGSADQLRAVLHGPEAESPTVILDLRAVTFIDSSGLGVIVGNNRRATAERFRFAVAVGGARMVERVLDLSGLRDTLTIVGDPDELLAR